MKCRICGGKGDRLETGIFCCQDNPNHVADAMTGIWSDLTHPGNDYCQDEMNAGMNMLDPLQNLRNLMRKKHRTVMDPRNPDQFRTDLPTFGGDDEIDTEGVWSWDKTRLLVGTCGDDLEIVERN